MKISIEKKNDWEDVYEAALNTVNKKPIKKKKFSSEWKNKMITAEHSPIRQLRFKIRIEDLPYFASVHLARHKHGVEHYVTTQRSDRTGVKRDKKPQDEPVNHLMYINAEAIINISRKRLCYQADPVTRDVWLSVIMKINKIEPELVARCVTSCQYRGFCPEFKSCGFFHKLEKK